MIASLSLSHDGVDYGALLPGKIKPASLITNPDDEAEYIIVIPSAVSVVARVLAFINHRMKKSIPQHLWHFASNYYVGKHATY